MGFLSKIQKWVAGSDNTSANDLPFPLSYDMHSHLLPGLDDGVKSFEEAIAFCRALKELGFEKLITTPHVMGDYYQNSPDTIRKTCDQLNEKLLEQKISIEVSPAAEYYLDEWFLDKVKNKEVLPVTENYVLIETPFLSEPAGFKKIIFEMQTHGYKPILAHPERYVYVPDSKKYQEWVDMGISLQVNITSLSAMNSEQVRRNAKKLIEMKLVHFAGTDLHNERHLQMIKEAVNRKSFRKLAELDLVNKRK